MVPIRSTPGELLEGLWAERSGYRTPPRSALLSAAGAGSAGDVFFAHSDASLSELLHSAEADVFISRGFAVGTGGDGELRPAMDMGTTFRSGCWSPG